MSAVFPRDATGRSLSSAEDYAAPLVDELEENEVVRRRITVVYWPVLRPAAGPAAGGEGPGRR
ncbi:hypothetical protein P1S61_10575 [Streptomyces sp. ME08-AFT2]|uniref:hypothetical protein n=1 Tax=Streptomyces sp. ME08-AFT2 TaxID=3028683 RepID=UPI0029B503E6|nr:hypothetical protein [Streptomyces sp. ME08-AFT2]MDX3309534.1 hypothetical protein [Streptomyces sp. ME08-AFT2]